MARTGKLSAVEVTKARGRRCCMTAASAIRVFRADDHRARAVGVMSLNRTDGPPPIERMTPPSMVWGLQRPAASWTTTVMLI